MKSDPRKAFFIINPASGQGDPKKRKTEIVRIAKSLGWNGKTLQTTRTKDASILAAQAIKEGANHIVVCGGDGTIMEALQAVSKTKVVLGIVPLGTGNLFAQNLGLLGSKDDAIRRALFGVVQRIDIGKVNDTFFAIIAGIGFDAEIMKETNRKLKNKYGFFAYLLSSVKAFNKKSGVYEISLDNKPFKRYKAKSILVANMGKIQAGIEAVPHAHHQSGVLHIAVIQASTFRSFLSILGNALLGKVQQSPHFTLMQAKTIQIRSLKGAKSYQCDGNHFPPTSSLFVEIFPKSVSILVEPKLKQKVGSTNMFASLLQF